MRKLSIISMITAMFILAFSLNMQPTYAAGSIEAQPISGPTLTQQIVSRAEVSWPWYLVRASGIVAAVSLVILMLSGIGLISGHVFRILEPITAWASHRALGIVFVVSVLIHMFGLLFDHFVSFDLASLFIPWLSDFKPATIFGFEVGSLYIALGILAFYGAALVVITSLVWVEKKPYLWKLVHLLSYLVMFFVFLHVLHLGTDFAEGWSRFLWVATGLTIGVLSLYRLWRSKSL